MFRTKLLLWVHREGWEETSTNSALPGPGEVSCRYLQGAEPVQAVLAPWALSPDTDRPLGCNPAECLTQRTPLPCPGGWWMVLVAPWPGETLW